MSGELTVERLEFCHRLVAMKAEAGRLGLFRTMHKLDLATVEIGYELAGEPTPKDRLRP